jgi:hypothetical protein
MARGKACEHVGAVRDSLPKVPTVGHLRAGDHRVDCITELYRQIRYNLNFHNNYKKQKQLQNILQGPEEESPKHNTSRAEYVNVPTNNVEIEEDESRRR